jgi:hypothetical protein
MSVERAARASVMTIFIGLKGRRSPAQGESLGSPAEKIIVTGLKGRRRPAKHSSPGAARAFALSVLPDQIERNI